MSALVSLQHLDLTGCGTVQGSSLTALASLTALRQVQVLRFWCLDSPPKCFLLAWYVLCLMMGQQHPFGYLCQPFHTYVRLHQAIPAVHLHQCGPVSICVSCHRVCAGLCHSANVKQEVLRPRSDVTSCRSLNLNGCRSVPGIDAALAALTTLDSLSELSLQVRY